MCCVLTGLCWIVLTWVRTVMQECEFGMPGNVNEWRIFTMLKPSEHPDTCWHQGKSDWIISFVGGIPWTSNAGCPGVGQSGFCEIAHREWSKHAPFSHHLQTRGIVQYGRAKLSKFSICLFVSPSHRVRMVHTNELTVAVNHKIPLPF